MDQQLIHFQTAATLTAIEFRQIVHSVLFLDAPSEPLPSEVVRCNSFKCLWADLLCQKSVEHSSLLLSIRVLT